MNIQGGNLVGSTTHSYYNRCSPMPRPLGKRSVTVLFVGATDSLCQARLECRGLHCQAHRLQDHPGGNPKGVQWSIPIEKSTWSRTMWCGDGREYPPRHPQLHEGVPPSQAGPCPVNRGTRTKIHWWLPSQTPSPSSSNGSMPPTTTSGM